MIRTRRTKAGGGDTMRLYAWIAAALLAGSWLFGLEYFYPVCWWAWLASIAAAVGLFLAESPRACNQGSGGDRLPSPAANPPPPRVCRGALAAAGDLDCRLALSDAAAVVGHRPGVPVAA